MVQAAGGLVEQLRVTENVNIVRTRHKESCFLCTHRHLALPSDYCDCGANDSVYGRDFFAWKNVITNDGDIYYAEAMAHPQGAGGTTETFSAAYVGTTGNAVAKTNVFNTAITVLATSPEQAVTATYPKANDLDADNGGKGTSVATWKFEYTTAGGVGLLTDIVISRAAAAGANPILMHADAALDWTPAGTVNKTASDTLKFYVNHTALGA